MGLGQAIRQIYLINKNLVQESQAPRHEPGKVPDVTETKGTVLLCNHSTVAESTQLGDGTQSPSLTQAITAL